ncbi:GntR family transcriptional regulator [Virgibacillus halodenitrificans]|nr:GntR family transcriptional regulator [Virgibacillus halodenitrificans]MCJ0930055.1 GntR family transcriptional regulator [Virgibacillus halodenitrificans]WHX26560.1 GntR family transcriptional regulator [Virgibacillus halodenitrificans]CDQ31028.1 HTH-type transcriptional repressor YvoA [Virgibacillus halodenitrificans]
MDKKSRIPLYLQLMDELIRKINNKTYQENEKLPSERELCEIYDLSRITVRQALQELEREGYIYKLHGKGTFISSKTYNQKLVQLYSFTEQMKMLGKKPTTKVITFQQIPVDDRLAEKMELQPMDEVFQIVRLRLADEEPLMYETSYIPKKLFPKLSKETLENRPMYDIFQEDYQVGVTKAREHFSATTVRQEEASFLEMTKDQSAMLIKRYAYHQKNLIEYTISIARGDKFDYTVELT